MHAYMHMYILLVYQTVSLSTRSSILCSHLICMTISLNVPVFLSHIIMNEWWFSKETPKNLLYEKPNAIYLGEPRVYEIHLPSKNLDYRKAQRWVEIILK